MRKHWKLLTLVAVVLLFAEAKAWFYAAIPYSLLVPGMSAQPLVVRDITYPGDGSICFRRLDDGGKECAKVAVYVLRQGYRR